MKGWAEYDRTFGCANRLRQIRFKRKLAVLKRQRENPRGEDHGRYANPENKYFMWFQWPIGWEHLPRHYCDLPAELVDVEQEAVGETESRDEWFLVRSGEWKEIGPRKRKHPYKPQYGRKWVDYQMFTVGETEAV